MKRILFVHARGGVPLDHAVPRMAPHGVLHMLAVAPPAKGSWRDHCADVIEAWSDNPRGEDLVELIVETAKEIGADAVVGFSEYVLLAVSLAAGRLGLPGPGDNVRLSRDKRLMRERWAQAGVPIPAFRRVGNEADLLAAFHELASPMLLKPAWGAGSVGQRVLRTEADIAPAWQAITAALAELARHGLGEYYETEAPRQLLVEEIIAGSVDSWYDEPGFGDYLSVEGMVAAGEFHPIAITGRIPTIPPFTELSSHAPTALDEPAQRRIEAVARAAVDALDLDTCGTHTEIKLRSDGSAVLIESAARFGGSAITGVIESVFGIDMVGMLTRRLLGEPVDYPTRMLTTGSCSAAELSLIGTDAAGTPWQSTPVWDSRTADLAALVSPGSTITHVTGMTAPDGTVVPRYDEARGITNCIGMLLLTAPDRHQMLKDTYAVLNGLEGRLTQAMVGTSGQEGPVTSAAMHAHPITITETDRIAEIQPARWDRLAGRASLYSTHAWLDYVEQYGDCAPRYLLAHQGDRAVAALPTYRFAGTIPRFYDPEFLVPGAGAGRPVLIAGSRQGYATEFLLDPDLDGPTRTAALLALLDRLRAEAAELTILLYLPEDALAHVGPLLSDQDEVFLLDARARLAVPPDGLAGYRALVSNNTRARMRKEMRRFVDAGCHAEVRRLSECHNALGDLSAQVLQRYGHPITAEGEADRFAAQSRTLDELCHVILAKQDERVVGFTQFFGWKDVLFGRLHGLDDTMARSAALYYNLTYYRAIEFAAEHGYTTIDLGCDSYEAKVRRGAQLDLLWGLALAPGWSADVTTALARAGRARLEEFAAWDPGVRAGTTQELLGGPTVTRGEEA